MEWINYKENYPSGEDKYLVWIDGECKIVNVYDTYDQFNDTVWYDWYINGEQANDKELDRIKWWMPLPQPPKE